MGFTFGYVYGVIIMSPRGCQSTCLAGPPVFDIEICGGFYHPAFTAGFGLGNWYIHISHYQVFNYGLHDRNGHRIAQLPFTLVR